jgi:hypothetical protein
VDQKYRLSILGIRPPDLANKQRDPGLSRDLVIMASNFRSANRRGKEREN